MGGVYAWSPYHCPGSFPHPAAMSHNIDVNISNHPGEGISQLSSVSAMSANTGVNQPHIGYTFPNNRMNMPNDMTNWGSTQPMRMPTSQATSTAGAPAFNFQLAANQHGTFQRNTFQHGTAQQGHIQQGSIQQGPFQQRTVQQAPLQQGAIPHGTVRHGQSQYGHDQHGRIQQGPAKRIKVENGTEQHMSNSYGLKQPAPGASRASVNPESSSPLQNPGNRDIEAITGSDDFLETVDPRDVQLIPEDNIGLDLDDQWLLLPPQHSQAVAQVSNLWICKFRGREANSQEQQYPDPAAQHGAGSPAGTPSGHVPPPLVHTTAPMTEEQVRQYSDLYQENYVGAWPDPTTASQAFAFMRQNAHQVSTNK